MRFARTAVTALVATSALGVAATSPAGAVTNDDADVFISELHYDNDGADTGEAVEVFGPAGTDLTGWSIVLYNGSSSQLNVYDTIALSGVIAGEAAGFGVADFAATGIQNGGPDGLALVAPDDSVVQFLSYEGSFTPVDGPAAGMVSTDIGVSEPTDSPVGQSLQLAGTGSCYGALDWAGPADNTFGSLGAIAPDPTAPCIDDGGDDPTLRINELHYDNDGADTGEAVEVFGPAGTDLTGYSIVLYNGSSSQLNVYDTVALTGTIADLDATGTGVIAEYITGIQNGAPDGLALVAPDDTVIEFLSYEGTFTAANGPAAGLTSTDIGVAEAGNEPEGLSLQRNDDLTWTGPVCESFGELNDPTATTDCDGGNDGPAEALEIWEVQGSGFSSPYDGQRVVIDGFVVGDFQGSDQLNGFHVQEPAERTDGGPGTADGDPATSDGIFVYSNSPVEVGDFVTVTGTVDEYFELTEITDVESVVVSDTDFAFPAPTTFSLPADDVAREAVEGMLVTLPQSLVISEYFNFDRYNEIVLSTERQLQPTAIVEPGDAATALAAEQELHRIMLDDGRSTQNSDPARHPNGDPFTLDNLFRGGDLVTNTTGVMDYSFDLYRIQPTQGADYTSANERPTDPPDVGGDLTVASFNVLNYFNTIDDGTNDICGPNQAQECRGADDDPERVRQLDKIVAAMLAIDADVYGIIEVENTPGVEAMADIVDGMNATAGAGDYTYVDTGTIGTDAIKVGFIYDASTTETVEGFAILDETVDERFDTSKNRPALAQTFRSIESGGEVTVSVNHLKSKGSACDDVGDPDAGDGSGNCNGTRAAAAAALADWMAGNPTGVDAPNLIIGDLNSYDLEDPIDELKAAGYTDLVAQYQGEEAYSYVFDGRVGYLDHALADAELAEFVTGAAVWHINADEADLIDYDTSFKADAQDAIYAPDPFRSSDHDPVIVGLDLDVCDVEAPVIDIDLSTTRLWPPIGILLPVRADVTAIDAVDGEVDVELVSVVSDEPNERPTRGPWWKRWFQEDIVIVDDDLFLLRAERDPRGDGRTYTITYSATDSCGNWSLATATVEVPKSLGHGWGWGWR